MINHKSYIISIIILSFLLNLINIKAFAGDYSDEITDTVFAGKILPNAALITGHGKFSLLIYADHTYKSIKYLDNEVKRQGGKLCVVSKLYNGTYTNTDSVIVDRQTLIPLESHSDINTSKDNFMYSGNKINGTMEAKDGDKKGAVTKIDTAVLNPMFNGLIYIETYQALTYQKNRPFYLAEYVPGHNTKFTKIEYIKDDEITVSGVKIAAKLLEMKNGNITIYCWLNTKNQEILKMEGKFPQFDYYLYRIS